MTLALLFGLSSSAVFQGADIKAEGSAWTDPNLGTYEIEGACSVSVSAISCWNPKGAPSEELAQKVRKYLEMPQVTVDVRMGVKNRLVVGKWTPKDQKEVSGLGIAPTDLQGTWNVIGCVVFAKPEQKTTSVRLGITHFADPGVQLTPKAGSKVILDGKEVKISKIVKTKGGRLNTLGKDPDERLSWRIYLESDLKLIEYKSSVVAKSGKNLPFVNAKGKFLPEPTLVKDDPLVGTTRVGFDMVRQKDVWIDTNIDPAELKHIVFQGQRKVSVVFSDIALDPKN